MQFNTTYLDNYIPHEEKLDKNTRGTDYYHKYSAVRAVCDHAQENDANMYDLFDPLTACAYGIATFYGHYQIHGTIGGALRGYTGLDERAATEIIEYRNLLAAKDGQAKW